MMNLVRRLVGTKNDRELKRLVPYVERINQLEPALVKLSDAALAARTPVQAAPRERRAARLR